MHEWRVTLTQHAPRLTGLNGRPAVEGRWIAATVTALDANDARRRAQKVHTGWTAVLVERAA